MADPTKNEPGGTTPPNPAPAAEPNAKTFDEKYVHELREEAKQNRLEVARLKKENEELAARNTADLAKVKKALGLEGGAGEPDIEALLKTEREKSTATERMAKDAILRAEAIRQAAMLNFHDPEAAARLIERDLVEVDLVSGKTKGVEEAVKALAAKSPYLVKSAAPAPAAGAPAPNLMTAGGNANPPAGPSHEETMKRLLAEAKTKSPNPEVQSAWLLTEKKKLGIR